MKVRSRAPFLFQPLWLVIVLVLGGAVFSALADPEKKVEEKENPAAGASLPATVEEARARARWLHEGFRGALLVMHRDFFEEEDPGMLPSQSLDDVFESMEEIWSVKIRWLGVNATKGINHKPKDRFEEAAAAAIESGKLEYEAIEGDQFRFVGMVPLKNECLKCHVRHRTSLEDRFAGLAISIPMKTK